MAEVGVPEVEERARTDCGRVSKVGISAGTGGAVAAAVGKALFDRRWASCKAELQNERPLVPPQLAAYRQRWALTEITSPSRGRALPEEERSKEGTPVGPSVLCQPSGGVRRWPVLRGERPSSCAQLRIRLQGTPQPPADEELNGGPQRR